MPQVNIHESQRQERPVLATQGDSRGLPFRTWFDRIIAHSPAQINKGGAGI